MAFEIRKLADDEQITEPGFYAITLDRHHSQPCNGVSVTSGVLRKMILETPDVVWATHDLNPDPWEKGDTTALKLGRAMAAMVEGGTRELREHYVVIDSTSPNKPTEAQIAKYEAGKGTEAGIRSVDFWRQVEEDGRDVLNGEQLKMILNMSKALATNPDAIAALSGNPEITMAWFDEETQLWVLARPDQVSFSGLLSDYKKISAQGRVFDRRICNRRVIDHGYHMQMGLASEAFEILTGNWPDAVGLIFQNDKAPYASILMDLPLDSLIVGKYYNRLAMRLFRKCLDAKHWPGPGEDIATFKMPDWYLERALDDMGVSEGDLIAG